MNASRFEVKWLLNMGAGPVETIASIWLPSEKLARIALSVSVTVSSPEPGEEKGLTLEVTRSDGQSAIAGVQIFATTQDGQATGITPIKIPLTFGCYRVQLIGRGEVLGEDSIQIDQAE